MSLLFRCKRRFPAVFALARSAYFRLGSILLSVFSISRISLAFYYFVIERSFWREQYAATKGVIRYRAQAEQSARLSLLRRNVHRLEKGLSMQPRRSCFALDYIQETVDTYKGYARDSGLTDADPIIAWARDVLEEYFGTVTSNSIIEKARETFVSCEHGEAENRVPVSYVDRQGQSHGIGLDSLRMLSRSRRSIRWFQDASVPRDLLDRALEVAVQGPSSCNRQPFRFCIFDDRKIVRQLVALPRGTRRFADNIACLVVVIGDLSNCSSLCDRHGIYIDVGLSVMGLLYALESLGVGSCVLNWPDVESLEKRMEKFLGLRPHERVVLLVAVGVPDPSGMVPYSAKTSLEKVRTYNFEGCNGRE